MRLYMGGGVKQIWGAAKFLTSPRALKTHAPPLATATCIRGPA